MKTARLWRVHVYDANGSATLVSKHLRLASALKEATNALDRLVENNADHTPQAHLPQDHTTSEETTVRGWHLYDAEGNRTLLGVSLAHVPEPEYDPDADYWQKLADGGYMSTAGRR